MSEYSYASWTGLNPVSDEHDQMQKKTFTKWINYHLETVSFFLS